MLRNVRFALCGVALLAAPLFAQNWETVQIVPHSTLQAVHPDGRSAYTGGFPLRVIGIALHNTEDWLDPTPGYTPTFQPGQMGGQAELFVQALDRSTLDLLGVEYYDPADFGGTAAWIGQNYGNLPWKGDSYFSYTDAEWTAELGRLNFFGGDGVTDPIRAGDLVEIRARAGLHYAGKLNINEQHEKDPAKDFEVVRLVAGFGLPAPALITLEDLKNPDDTHIFDPTRATGGERYQATRVQIQNVWTDASQSWLAGSDLWVTDGTRTFQIRLGNNPSFDGTPWFDVAEPFDVVGVMNQSATDGTYSTDGYYLIVMNATDFFVPPPVIVAAESRKTHGDAGIFDIDVWAGEIECRTGGVTTLVVTFDQDVAPVEWPDVEVSSGLVDDVQIDGAVVTVTISGGVVHGTLTVWFPGLADAATGKSLVTDTVNALTKLGDVNNSGATDSSDLLLVRDNLFQAITQSNFTTDVNASGAIDATDLLIVRDNLFQ